MTVAMQKSLYDVGPVHKAKLLLKTQLTVDQKERLVRPLPFLKIYGS